MKEFVKRTSAILTVLVMTFVFIPVMDAQTMHAEADEWDDDYCDYEYCDHFWWEQYKYKKYNSKYHKMNEKCDDCGEIRWVNEKHTFSRKIIKYATPKTKGKIRYQCTDCGYKKKVKTVKWKRGGIGSRNYDIKSHSYVYRNSKRVKVRLKNVLKGSVVKVKIGKKVYSKKLKSSKKTVKVKIKKSKYGKSIKLWVTYKGKTIGKDMCDDWYKDVVWYGDYVRKGMTKKQVKYTWGPPDRKASSSGGWSYWYWDDGSYVDFKHGKVKYWYDAEG